MRPRRRRPSGLGGLSRSEPRQMNAPCARTRLCKKQSHSQWACTTPLSILRPFTTITSQ